MPTFSKKLEHPTTKIYLLPKAVEEADQFLNKPTYQESKKRLASVQKLISGFEDPYGMELLASLHWAVTKENVTTEKDAIYFIQGWNERKRKIFHSKHIPVAWKWLKSKGWI